MHPTTDVASMEHLTGKLICVAARVVGDAPTENAVKSEKGTVHVANACIRMENQVVRVAGWRDEVAAVKSLRMDGIYYFEAICVKPIFNKGKQKSVELLVVKGTNITVCDEPLRSRVLTITPESSAGARMWTNVMGFRRDYAKELVQWYSLSVFKTI